MADLPLAVRLALVALYLPVLIGVTGNALHLGWRWPQTLWFARWGLICSVAGFTQGYFTGAWLLVVLNAMTGLSFGFKVSSAARKKQASLGEAVPSGGATRG